MKGVLLVNLGTPDSPETKDVRKYLDQFLMDEQFATINRDENSIEISEKGIWNLLNQLEFLEKKVG